MPAKHSLHVVLTEPLVRYVRDKVAQGDHPTISEVIRTSLQASIAIEEAKRPLEEASAPKEDRHGR